MIESIRSLSPVELTAQVIGIVAMLCFVLSFQFKKNMGCFVMQMLGGSLFCVHFFLLGSIGGFLMNILGVLRAVVLLFGDRTHKPLFLGLLMALFAGAGAVSIVFKWDSPLVLISSVAQIAALLGMWTQNARKLRIVQFCITSPCWIVYDWINRSVGGVLCEIFNMISVIVYFLRVRMEAHDVKVTEKES